MVGDAAEDDAGLPCAWTPTAPTAARGIELRPVVRPATASALPDDVPAWHEVLNTDAARYGGGDVVTPRPGQAGGPGWHGRLASIRLTLPPLATV